jgi:hypothetical protein
MAFNVDLLHPGAGNDDGPVDEMFVDQLDIGVPINQFVKQTYLMKSIVTPDIQFVFEDSRWVDAPFHSTLPDGTDGSGRVPVIDELGLIVSKAKSVENPKRERDAFDIAISVAQARSGTELRRLAQDMETRRGGTFTLLGHIWRTVHNDELKPSFLERIFRSSADIDMLAAEHLVRSVDDFLNDVNVHPVEP